MDPDIESGIHTPLEGKHETPRSLGQTPASSLRAHKSQGQLYDFTPPGEPDSPSSFILNRLREGQFHGTLSPGRSVQGSFEINRAGEKNSIVTPSPDMSPSENFNIKVREATTIGSTPPPSVSPSESLNIKRREVRVVGSTPPPEPSLSLPEDWSSTGLPRIQTATNFDAALEQILQLPFDDRLLKVSMNDLAYKVSEGRDSPLTLNFATLYRMRLHKLRSEMVKHVFEIRYHNKLATGWEAALKEYVEAWRDWDYVNECAKRKNDPFLLKSSSCLDAALLREHLAGIKSGLASDDPALMRQYDRESSFPGPKDLKEPDIVGGLRNRVNRETQFRAFNVRLAMAGLGWAFIVGPMLLMVLSDTKVTALCTSSVCVFAFGVLMARTLEKPFDVMSATAAYAAVLVVFVGSNTAPGG